MNCLNLPVVCFRLCISECAYVVCNSQQSTAQPKAAVLPKCKTIASYANAVRKHPILMSLSFLTSCRPSGDWALQALRAHPPFVCDDAFGGQEHSLRCLRSFSRATRVTLADQSRQSQRSSHKCRTCIEAVVSLASFTFCTITRLRSPAFATVWRRGSSMARRDIRDTRILVIVVSPCSVSRALRQRM